MVVVAGIGEEIFVMKSSVVVVGNIELDEYVANA